MIVSEKIYAYCREKGVKNCPKRLIVVDTLQKMNTHTTADEIWLKMKERREKISIGSVYLNLNWLVEKGFAERWPGSDKKMLYNLTIG